MVPLLSHRLSIPHHIWFRGVTSTMVLASCGVPQGSVLEPILFLAISDKYGSSVHAYTDDMQLYDHAD